MPHHSPHKTVALSSLVNHEPVTIAPDTPLAEVLAIMEHRKIGCLLTVDEQHRPAGIFTEQDAVRLLVGTLGEQRQPQTMADVMQRPVFALAATVDCRDGFREMISRRFRYLAVVDALGKLVGVVSEGDFMRYLGFERMFELKTVASAMTLNPLALDGTETLDRAARLMADKRIGCVLVTQGGAPVGLVSERDMVRFSRMGPAQLQRPLAEVMSGPLQTVRPDMPLQEAAHHMEAFHIRRLGVVEEGRLVGILTRHDVVKAQQGRYIEYLHETIQRHHHEVQKAHAEMGLLSQKLKAYKLMEHVSDAILVAQADTGQVVEANASACRLLGYEHTALLRVRLDRLLRPNRPDKGWASLGDSLPPHGRGTFHLDLLTSDGRSVPCQVDIRQVSEDGSDHIVLVARDMSDLMAQSDQIRLQIQALNALDHAVVITDITTSVVWANAAFTRLTGYELAEAVGRKPAELVKSGKQDKAFYERIWSTILAGNVWRGELINRRKDGQLYDEEMAITPIYAGADGVITNFIAVKQDITERKAQEAKLRQLSITDPLTGVENRRGFMVQLERLHARQRRHGHPLSVLMFDLDWFKRINDQHGHAVGDEVLKRVTQLVGQRLRRSDHLGRLGGEEFAVLLPDTHLDGAHATALELCQSVAMEPVMTAGGPIPVTVSVGVAEVGSTDANPEDALVRADLALYRAKAQGRNRVVMAEPELTAERLTP
ncbi:MAG: diguanylate cyclase [Hydrogenophaga sp.]|uniref:diguanylate cyclase n=1 Tax=Hydrogenophaga sp. TaxID=1904254 RepID=UPI002716242B|nr:diguanylate cyclase [Hydrogenophaga sp.]MDO9567917.1 diguanylate cyclase [Hydrogenophaga sp.]